MWCGGDGVVGVCGCFSCGMYGRGKGEDGIGGGKEGRGIGEGEKREEATAFYDDRNRKISKNRRFNCSKLRRDCP